MTEEAALIASAAHGDQAAFEALVRSYQAPLRSLVAMWIPSREDVDDIVQDAFIDAYRGLGGFDHQQEFGPWMRTICRNRMRMFLRARAARRRHELALVDAALAETADLDGEDAPQAERAVSALRTCLRSLGEAHRRILDLRFSERLPVQEIAAVLGMTPNLISVRLLRIKAALRRCLHHALAAGGRA